MESLLLVEDLRYRRSGHGLSWMSSDGARGGVLRLLAVGSLVAVLGISLAATRGIGMRYLVFLHEIPGGDVLGHFLLFGLVAFLAGLAFIGSVRSQQPRRWRRVVLVLMLLVSIDEVAQIFLPLRSFSLQDLFANYTGIFFFSLLAWAIRLRVAPTPGTE